MTTTTTTTTKYSCTELASALFTTISLTATGLVISPWTMAMLESDMVKNEECRTVGLLLILYAVLKSCILGSPYNKKAELSQR